MRNRLLPGLALSLALAAGCAAYPRPTEELRAAYAAIARAVDAGAERHAPRELALAREKAALAERQIAGGDYKPARWLVEQALADAELAVVKATAARATQRGSGQ